MSTDVRPDDTTTQTEPPAGERERRRSRWWWAALVPVVAFAVLLASGLGRDPRAIPDVIVGKAAPAFSLPALDGSGPVDLASLRGNVVVVNFWASWCVECRQEHPALLAAWDRYRERGVVFVGVDFEDSATDARRYAADMGGDWPVVSDPGSKTAIAFGVFGVPETYVVAPDGTVIAKRIGGVDYAWLTDRIERALATGERS
jgi:cytochrome c biogenesis protein CcmG, thiol:disulfide interchange protein DsbE